MSFARLRFVRPARMSDGEACCPSARAAPPSACTGTSAQAVMRVALRRPRGRVSHRHAEQLQPESDRGQKQRQRHQSESFLEESPNHLHSLPLNITGTLFPECSGLSTGSAAELARPGRKRGPAVTRSDDSFAADLPRAPLPCAHFRRTKARRRRFGCGNDCSLRLALRHFFIRSSRRGRIGWL